jgi:imidazolonepropionase-like amidohydrolase
MLGKVRHFVYTTLLCVLSVRTFASPQPAQSTTIVISHVNVIPMDTERVLEDRTVIIRDGMVWKIADRAEAPPKGALLIDGRGKFLIPGLADLHVHLFSGDDLSAYVFYGVTTVLNMDGGPQHLRWRSQVRDGKILGPTIYTAGHTIDGFPPLNEMFLTAETPVQGHALVREQKRAGYDVIKLYGTLRPDVFRAILDAAVQEKIPVVGHINRQVGALEVLKSSQALAAHLEDLLFARFDHQPSDAELEEFATAIAQSHITVTPNLNVNPTNIAQLENLDVVLKSQPAKLLSPAAYSQWMPANNRNERNDQTPQQIEMMKGAQQMLYKMVRLLQAKKVRLALGTDAAAYGFPGLSAHQELQELVEAGFTPYQALRTATSDAGSFVADTIPGSPRIGTVTEGAEADLLLLSSNPLADIKHTSDIAGVILRGRWLSADELSRQRTATENRFAAIKRETERIDTALESGETGSAQEWAKKNKAESPCIAEWVLMSKVRKLQGKDLPAAIRVARLNAQWYPESFSARYLLADVLFQAGTFAEASKTVKESLAREPRSAAALNLAGKIATAQHPARFNVAGSYKIEYVNDQSHDAQTAELVISGNAQGPFHGKSIRGNQMDLLQSLTVGGDRLWAVANSGYGPLEFRITVHGDELSGYWAGPFGQNGTLRGTKSK